MPVDNKELEIIKRKALRKRILKKPSRRRRFVGGRSKTTSKTNKKRRIRIEPESEPELTKPIESDSGTETDDNTKRRRRRKTQTTIPSNCKVPQIMFDAKTKRCYVDKPALNKKGTIRVYITGFKTKDTLKKERNARERKKKQKVVAR